MQLVVVESPAKAKTIQKYLGNGYIVKSSKGHVADLPKSQLGVDTENDYQPEYLVTKKEVIADLKKTMKSADSLILAVDPDREGEAIGWHVARELGLFATSKKKSGAKDVQRIVFTEITKDAVQEAIKKPRNVDMDLVNAQQARRILDRLVGYKLSPLLWKKIRYGLSAGRVQSVAVKLIVDREREREAFDSKEYWRLRAYLKDKPAKGAPEIVMKKKESTGEVDDEEAEEKSDYSEVGIEFELVKIDGKKFEYTSQKGVESAVKTCAKSAWVVKEVSTKQSNRNPYPPFSTSSMQQDASNRLGFAAKRTMQVAQKLYEAGHITYMRTDSISMSSNAVALARTQISKKYGAKYLPEKANFYKTSSKVAQEAHEAIRPTHFGKSVKELGLSGDESRLYDLIYRRALASQMSPARFENQKITAVCDEYEFNANGRKTLFAGFLEAYSDSTREYELPHIAEGANLYPHLLLQSQHFTQPPPRYSEATLVKELESLGIGRPSTYAPIIQTIQTRKYVEKEGRYFKPTDTGTVVTDLLTKHFDEIVDVGFTAEMEDKLDAVANGELDWVKMMDQFYKPFISNIKSKDKSIKKEDVTVLGKSNEKCPECGKKMVIKLGRFGKFLSCADFPECKGMLPLSEEEGGEGAGLTADSKEFKEQYLSAPKTDDGRDYLLKQGRFGQFWAHPDYPKVKDARPLELLPEKIIELYGAPPKSDSGVDYLLKQGKFGPFWAHPDYPKVKDIVAIKKRKK